MERPSPSVKDALWMRTKMENGEEEKTQEFRIGFERRC
jgi:hypothetical protein